MPLKIFPAMPPSIQKKFENFFFTEHIPTVVELLLCYTANMLRWNLTTFPCWISHFSHSFGCQIPNFFFRLCWKNSIKNYDIYDFWMKTNFMEHKKKGNRADAFVFLHALHRHTHTSRLNDGNECLKSNQRFAKTALLLLMLMMMKKMVTNHIKIQFKEGKKRFPSTLVRSGRTLNLMHVTKMYTFTTWRSEQASTDKTALWMHFILVMFLS